MVVQWRRRKGGCCNSAAKRGSKWRRKPVEKVDTEFERHLQLAVQMLDLIVSFGRCHDSCLSFSYGQDNLGCGYAQCDLYGAFYCLEDFFMKPIVLAGFVVLASVSGMANANCTTDPRIMATGRTNLTTTFSNKLVCGRPGANYPGQGGASSPDRWQEQHNTSGRLVDFKKGPTDPVDPSETVGSWSIDPTNSTIVHKYKGGATYAWEVRLAAGGKYSFCVGGAEHVVAFIPPGVGASGCGGRFP